MAQRIVKVDGKVRTDETYPAGFMGEARRGGTDDRGLADTECAPSQM